MWFTLSSGNIDFIPREKLLYFLGSFDDIKNPALRAARTGQNLSTGFTIILNDPDTWIWEDKKSGKYLYTDGIGMVSRDIVKRIQQ